MRTLSTTKFVERDEKGNIYAEVDSDGPVFVEFLKGAIKELEKLIKTIELENEQGPDKVAIERHVSINLAIKSLQALIKS